MHLTDGRTHTLTHLIHKAILHWLAIVKINKSSMQYGNYTFNPNRFSLHGPVITRSLVKEVERYIAVYLLSLFKMQKNTKELLIHLFSLLLQTLHIHTGKKQWGAKNSKKHFFSCLYQTKMFMGRANRNNQIPSRLCQTSSGCLDKFPQPLTVDMKPPYLVKAMVYCLMSAHLVKSVNILPYILHSQLSTL
jgi:hypothetical protein